MEKAWPEHRYGDEKKLNPALKRAFILETVETMTTWLGQKAPSVLGMLQPLLDGLMEHLETTLCGEV